MVGALVPGAVSKSPPPHHSDILLIVFQMDPANALTISGGALLMSVTGSLGMHSNKGHSRRPIISCGSNHLHRCHIIQPWIAVNAVVCTIGSRSL